MAQHKAPTEVTLVPHEEQSGLANFVERHWMKAAALAVAIAAGILFSQFQSQQASDQRGQSWGELMAALEQDRLTGRLIGDTEGLERLAQELQATDAGPWALFLQAQSLRDEARYDESAAAIAKLQQSYPDHPLVTQRYTFGESVTPLTLLDQVAKAYEAEGTWRADHMGLFENPAPPAGGPRVLIQTDQGDILIALYSERAPKLTENFLKLAGEGFYDGTRVHRIAAGMFVEAGDPDSRDGDAATWGLGGADYTLEKETTGLSNFEGYLSMVVKPGEEEPNGSLFLLTAAPMHYFNHRNVVFGVVVEGLDVVKEISNAATDAPSARPLNPIAIQSTEVIPGA